MSVVAKDRAAPDPRRWYALALLCGTFFMVILDAAIVNVAHPSIERDLNSIATLAGVHERAAGLASGLNQTSLQLGGALGTAVATVAVSRTDDFNGGHRPERTTTR